MAPLGHQRREAVKMVIRVMGARAGFWVVLHAEHGLVVEGEGGHRLVVEVLVRHPDPMAGQGGRVDGEAVVLAGDLHLPWRPAGMVEAAMAVGQLESASSKGKPKNLMTQADAKDGKITLA